MYEILPNQERARWVVIMLYINIVVTLVFAGSQWWQAGLVEAGDLTTEIAGQSDMIVGLSALVFLAVLIACAVVFILWFRRAYANLHRIEAGNSILSYTEGWAAGAWFVPFINLVRPYTIMKEIWNETQSNIPGKIEREGLQETSLVGWWWAAWITFNIVSNITNKVGGQDSVEEIALALRASALGLLLVIPAGLLAIRMVQQTNVFEQELYETRRMSDPMEHLVV
ncbi:MAG TPA: DUF4328 domain-containing protein [Saprospiraceae bacterium]|nr:DUF4328 domain-containing protein [Saprospiraceae bacterium]